MLANNLNICLVLDKTKTIVMDMIKSIPVHMDYVGQGRAEKLYQIIIVLFGVVGLFWGYTIQQFSQTVYILGAGLVLASLLTIPPWGIFRYPIFISRLQNVNFPM